MDQIRELIHEIHRRSIWQVVGIFIAGSWAVLQVVEVLTETAGLPDWTPSMALVLLLIGLPICVATAFVQEGMPGKEESPPRPTEDAAQERGWLTWRNAILGGVGAMALLGLSIMAYFVMWSTGIGPVGNLQAQGLIEEGEPVLLADFSNTTDDGALGKRGDRGAPRRSGDYQRDHPRGGIRGQGAPHPNGPALGHTRVRIHSG